MSAAVCPYCGEAVTPGEAQAHFCASCGTPHHEDCWQENGGCTVFGCASAPPEDAKVMVGVPDFEAAPQPPPGAPSGERIPPPPPFAGANHPQHEFTFGGYNPAAPPPQYAYPVAGAHIQKSRLTFILLGVFLGLFGVHNFYAGNTGAGIAQLCLTLLSCFILAPIVWIWNIVEVCTVDRDKAGVPMI
jgi:TM2 domain-containing protein/RING finger family protein